MQVGRSKYLLDVQIQTVAQEYIICGWSRGEWHIQNLKDIICQLYNSVKIIPLQGPGIDVLCDFVNGESEIVEPNPWPLCTPLKCVCLGNASLTNEQGLNITRTSCPSENTVNTFKDVSNRIYAIPKREQCGTFKPDDPTSDNTCVCPELDDGTLGLYYKYSTLCYHKPQSAQGFRA